MKRWCPSCGEWVSEQFIDATGHHEHQSFDIGRCPPLKWVRCPVPTTAAVPEPKIDHHDY